MASPFSGWNLIGNPYPSYIDFDAFFLLNKNELDPGYYQAIYGYDGNANDGWTILNNLTTNKLIAPGQGFFVKSKPGPRTITFTPAMRATGDTDDFILGRSTPSDINHLKLNITANNLSYNTDFYFTGNSTRDLDPGYDAALFGGNAPAFSIYSNLVENNTGTAYAIQALSSSDMDNVIIPLGVNASQGQNITISISENDIPESVNVYLEDRLNNTFTLLNSDSFSITADANMSGTGRFYLNFEGDALSTKEENLEGLNIYSDNTTKTIIIKGQLQIDTHFKLYDINGRVLRSIDLDISNNNQSINVEELSAGIYIAELISDRNEKRIEKLIIR